MLNRWYYDEKATLIGEDAHQIADAVMRSSTPPTTSPQRSGTPFSATTSRSEWRVLPVRAEQRVAMTDNPTGAGSTNMDILREFESLALAGQLDLALQRCVHPEIEVVEPPSLPHGGRWKGRGGSRR